MTDQERDQERRDLDDLVQSQGWRRLQGYVNHEWGAVAILTRIENAIATIKPGDTSGQEDSTVRLLAAREAIENLMVWPAKRIEKLEDTKPSQVPLVPRRAG